MKSNHFKGTPSVIGLCSIYIGSKVKRVFIALRVRKYYNLELELQY